MAQILTNISEADKSNFIFLAIGEGKAEGYAWILHPNFR